MIKGDYESYFAVCPYYAYENRYQMKCHGWHDKITLHLTFEEAPDCWLWKRKHCRDLEGYTECPVKQMIDYEIEAILGEEERKKKNPG